MLSFIGDAVAGLTGLRSSSSWDPWDDRWYAPGLGGVSGSGVHVTPETIYHCGVVLAALRFRADIFSQSQPTVYRSLSNGRREEVEDHYARVTLRDPCTWMTGVRWRHLQMIRAQLGNSHNLIVSGSSSFADELRPIDPSRIEVMDQRSDGTLLYEYRTANEPARTIGQERILHFRGFSTDGFDGLAMWTLLRNAVGIALLAEKHTATFLRKGNRIAGLLIPTTGDTGGKDKRAELAASVNEAFGSHENTGQMGVLPWGVDFKPLAMDNVKAQLMELRDYQVGDILRFLGVPGVVVGWGEKTATFASAEAFFEEARRCVLPWVVNFEAEEMKALLPRDGGLSIKHNLDAVLRADTAKRYEAIYKAAGRPWITGNEARATEDMDPITDDESMDKVAPPPNTNGSGPGSDPAPEPEPGPPRKKPLPKPAPPDDDEAEARSRAVQLVVDASARVVRREVAGLKDPRALRLSRDAAGWREWVGSYYERHAAHVAETLHVTEEQARAYAVGHRDELIAGGLGVVEGWEAEAVPRLASMALGETW